MARADLRTAALDAAERLFFSDGIAVTGVDAVAREAGVSVVTLYNHFGNKDGLVGAVLERRLAGWDEAWQAEIDACEDPREKVLAIFDAVAAFRARSSPTKWCSFLATASERPVADDPPARLVARENALLQARLRQYAEEADPGRSGEIVSVVTLIYSGVLSSLLRGTPDEPTAVGRRAAAAALGWDDLVTART